MSTPTFQYSPRSRTWSFGQGSLARALNFSTATWFRFEFSVCSLLLATIWIARAPSLPVTEFLGGIFVIPIAAILLVFFLRTGVTIAAFVPGIRVVVGLTRIAFVRALSWLIAEPAPKIEVPVWFDFK